MNVNQKENRLGEVKFNNQGSLMKIIEYNNANNIRIEFQDIYKTIIHTNYRCFSSGKPINPYCPSVFGIGVTGNKYPTQINNKQTKEYRTWVNILERCFNKKHKEKHPTYKNVTCCDEWLYYENFYEWLHSQENFEKWYNGKRWAIDKDILVKNSKVYSPETCCLVPMNVNLLFTKCDIARGDLPIGVSRNSVGTNIFRSICRNPFTNKQEFLGDYKTPEGSFQAYKKRKEFYIKQVAQIEYSKGNIIKQCYEAMMEYEVEITD